MGKEDVSGNERYEREREREKPREEHGVVKAMSLDEGEADGNQQSPARRFLGLR